MLIYTLCKYVPSPNIALYIANMSHMSAPESFSIISDKFVPFPAPRRGGAGRGRASLLRQVISVFHQNLSQLHISVVGGGVSSTIIRAVIQHLDIWSHWWRFDF